jgi:cytochrome P450
MITLASLFPREVVQDTEYKGIKFRKGAGIMLNNWYLSLNEKYYKDADKFIPERWLDGSLNSSVLFMPFGFGARVCFGQKLALTEMKNFVTLLLMKYQVMIDESKKPEFVFETGIAPKGKVMHLKLKEIDN